MTALSICWTSVELQKGETWTQIPKPRFILKFIYRRRIKWKFIQIDFAASDTIHHAKNMATPEETFSASSISSPSNKVSAFLLAPSLRSVGLNRPIRCLTFRLYPDFSKIAIIQKFSQCILDNFLNHDRVYQVTLASLAKSENTNNLRNEIF